MTPEMSRKRTTHLISAHESGIKLEKAQQWKIPVVSIEWLHATARAGAIQPVEAYQKALVRVGEPQSSPQASYNCLPRIQVVKPLQRHLPQNAQGSLPPTRFKAQSSWSRRACLT